MANLKLKNPSGGSLALVSADGASDLTLTFPAVTGTAMVSGNMPAFSAVASGTTAISAGTRVKVTFATEYFDTNNCFSSSRFTPTVAGYYQITASYHEGAGTSTILQAEIYKNGSAYAAGGYTAAGAYFTAAVTTIIYFNGTTDYVEGYCYSTASVSVGGDATSNFFCGSLVRAA